MHIFFKNIFSRLILISSKFLYPRHIIIFYFKKVYVLHFLIKHLIKTFIFKYSNDIDLRFYWNRKYDVNTYFNFGKFKSRELGDELRNCIKIPSKKFYILKTKKANLNFKLGFYFDSNYKNKIDGFVVVEDTNKNYLVKLADLTFGYWHDAWLTSKKKKFQNYK